MFNKVGEYFLPTPSIIYQFTPADQAQLLVSVDNEFSTMLFSTDVMVLVPARVNFDVTFSFSFSNELKGL